MADAKVIDLQTVRERGQRLGAVTITFFGSDERGTLEWEMEIDPLRGGPIDDACKVWLADQLRMCADQTDPRGHVCCNCIPKGVTTET